MTTTPRTDATEFTPGKTAPSQFSYHVRMTAAFAVAGESDESAADAVLAWAMLSQQWPIAADGAARVVAELDIEAHYVSVPVQRARWSCPVAARRNVSTASRVDRTMTLTLGSAPLGTTGPPDVNYVVEGPRHRILFDHFPRRVRATFNGVTVLDTVRGRLLHESNILPALYVPRADVRTDLLQPTDESTHCPFKGDANYWSIAVDDETSANAAWGYPGTLEGAEWLGDHLAFYWDRLDAWFDEDEQVHGHLRDPYHRVDARRSSRHVVVRRGDEVVAETTRPIVVSETGLPNRFYVPATDVPADLLTSSTTVSHCPYKGWSSYWSLRDGTATDVAFGYEQPFSDVSTVGGHRCFLADGFTTEVDGEVIS